MTNSKKVIILCLSFIGGISFASYFFSLNIFFLGLIACAFYKANKRILFAGICIIFFSLGCYRVESEVNKINQSHLFSFNEKEVLLTGIISKQVKQKEEKAEIIVDILNNGGRILVFTDKHSFLKYGDEVRIKGKLRIPQKLDSFDYQGYLAKSGVIATISYPQIEVVNSHSSFLGYIYKFKEESSQKIKNIMAPQVSPILEAMILGNSGLISKNTREALSKSGTSHIVAISGMHIVIFSTIVFWILLFLGLWRKQALVFSIFIIFLYIILVGAPASAMRAGIMIFLLFFAELFDRKSFNLRTMFLAASIILLFSPLLLKYDLGFQLSFLAVAGIILTSSSFNYWLRFIKWRKIREIIAVTASAQIFSLPVLISSFGYFSVVSFFSNILVIPIISIIMILGILIILLYTPIAFLISIPCSLLIFYLLSVTTFFSQLPFATINIPIVFIFLFYIPFIYFIYKGNKKDLEFLGQ